MKNFWSKWFVSASSGILGRMLLVVLCLGAGFVGGQYISIPIDKEIITGAGLFIGIIALFITAFFPIWLPMILEWSIMKKDFKIKSQELENENLKLKLKLQQQEQQSLPDQDE